MNYSKIYSLLIERAKVREIPMVKEDHHILPQSLGGNDSKENLVALTSREHYIAHWLLWKINNGQAKHKMAFAFFAMASMNNEHQRREISSRQFERAKEAMSEAAKHRVHHRTLKGRKVANKDGVEKWFKGEIPEGWNPGRSQKTKERVSASRKGAMNVWSKEQASAAASKGSKGKFWWYDPNSGEERRSIASPGPSFVQGSRKWYNDGAASQQFIEGFEPSGWTRGRLMNWKRGSPVTQ